MPGVMELLPMDQAAFQEMLDIIRRGFEIYGFLPIATPTMELAELLLRKTGGETERQVYLAQSSGAADQGEEPDLALRFDLTVPLARYVAEHRNELTFPFRRYQMQPVFRGERPQQGRFREFYQCDIDVVGQDSLSLRYDAEIPAVIDTVFANLGIGEFTIGISNRRLLAGLMTSLDMESDDAMMRELDKLSRRGPDEVIASLRQRGASETGAPRLVELAGRGVVTGEGALALLDELGAYGPGLEQGIGEVGEVLSLLGQLGVPSHRFGLDLGIARGLDYYTGTVYETTLVAHPELGSICSGGRYDDLAGHYTDRRLPGVGISIGLSRLFWQLRAAGILPAPRSPVTALVALIDDEGLEAALQIAADLRTSGINTESSLEPRKLAQQLKYADRSGIEVVVLAGPEERTKGEVLVRNLSRQSQEFVARANVAEAVSRMRSV
ncbi:MAG TPA: histidine--tRNA ligase [Acidimicrobiia bacterium]|nr:histidine--tRNA ligase [Acidimicrobiia bacterium]